MKKHIKLIISLVGAVLILSIAAVFLTTKDSPGLTDEEIRLSLRCDRFTSDYLVTDYYCNNLDDYRKDLKNNDLLDDDWPYEFGQQELQRRGYNN